MDFLQYIFKRVNRKRFIFLLIKNNPCPINTRTRYIGILFKFNQHFQFIERSMLSIRRQCTAEVSSRLLSLLTLGIISTRVGCTQVTGGGANQRDQISTCWGYQPSEEIDMVKRSSCRGLASTMQYDSVGRVSLDKYLQRWRGSCRSPWLDRPYDPLATIHLSIHVSVHWFFCEF